ncbi:AAA family ATPase [Anoxybacteroides rupiense]|uniref:Chromosome segregation protein SMC n=1 Tax=Anoxybacteroides rupiense TaxID=311460 RepID=A0ABD5IYC9_9BACL|nr:AAA family ATPase [Anoxybacillus rupiensis]MBB3906521.1 chromosome segregation protein [Anoxybacillus rupiensis]MED5052982.1 chromosome segregation protein SMC [Anoxybacillus rupiensis]
MIPWRLTFSGIRDYPPTLLDLSGIDEHVIITGPNGAGKSTITFCMGAVLYSSKVDMEGLKSRNLSSDQTWKARISFLFKNDGLMKIDAPTFIEFSLKIVQEPGQPIKKEFSISTGEAIDKWEETIKYTSGDRYYNFSTYKKDLQYKYKIDPDLFYLIWYQQEVNQFAVMNPEERFRIFSEMHGIDKIQKDWEESMEKMKETAETLRVAEWNVKGMKAEVAMKKAALDRFLDNQKRLHNGAKLYIESLLQLEVHYKKEKETLEELVQQMMGEIEDAKAEQAFQKSEKEKKKEYLTALRSNEEQLNLLMNEKYEKSREISQSIKKIEERIENLENELEEITLKKNQITRSEEEVKAALRQLTEEQTKTNNEFENTSLKLEELSNTWQEKVQIIADLNQQIETDEKLEAKHAERLREYKSSYSVQEKIDSLEKEVENRKDKKLKMTRTLQELQDELRLLEENRDLSARQMESLKFFRARQIKAYPLRELIELDESAKLKDEQIFNTIKYTIFFNEKHIEPPNDLYHVPLMKVIPDRPVMELPHLHLRIKKGLSEAEIPHAMKALWWVEQFFKGGTFTIKNGMLVDPMGIRGPQEKERFILSARAIAVRKQEVKQQIDKMNQQILQIDHEIENGTKMIQQLNGIIQQIRESEAFMTNELERTMRKKKYQEEVENRNKIEREKQALEKKKEGLIRLQIQQDEFKKKLQEEAAIYEELGKMKEKYEELNEHKSQLAFQKKLLKTHKNTVAELENDLEQTRYKIKETDRAIQDLDDMIEADERKIHSITKQKDNYSDRIETIKQELVQIIQGLNDLQNLIPAVYQEVVAMEITENVLSVHQLKQNCENGKVIFNQARNEENIDIAAPENYKTAKQEYDRLEDEYKRTKILLEQDIERTEQLRDKLETTINMRVLELQQRFKSYMSQFQFEGEISWQTFEDRKQRTHFNLYIKARKEGHRGTMEDVSTKARGGKVGKGVSGGEESLSSLLFALALLQNLRTAPGFIVLDEFDSALDENRKIKVFDLYAQELKRKLIILTPKSHEETYLNRFSKAFIVRHNPTIPESRVVGVVKKD